MKRFGHLIEKIITPENMLRAFKSVVDKLPTSKPIHYRSGKVDTTWRINDKPITKYTFTN